MKAAYLFLLLAFCLCIPPVTSAEIRFTADQKDYYFPLGQNAEIPLKVTSTFDHTIDGTIQFTTTEQLQKSGTVMTSTQNRVYTSSIAPGESQITLSGGASNVEKSVKVQVLYDYTDTTPMEVSLPEIIIHFVAQPPSASGSQSPLTSTSGASSGNVPSQSSVQIVQQTISAQQQAGRDGSPRQAVTQNQLPQDADALKQQLEKEAQKKEQDKKAFGETLEQDPLMQSVNRSMAADGFFRQALASNPAASNAGSFSADYRNAAGDSITVAGEMKGGIVPSVAELSRAPVNVTAPLAANATFRSMLQQMSDKGLSRNLTAMNVTLIGSEINITYQNFRGKRAFINATITGEKVNEVTLGIEPDPEVNYLPAIAAAVIAAVLFAGFWFVYRKFSRRTIQPRREPSVEIPVPDPIDYRKTALSLLTRAETAFRESRHAEAYTLAGRALRFFLAYDNGACREMTNTELIAFLRMQGMPVGKIQSLLDSSSDVGFAKGSGSEEEFLGMLVAIRGIVSG